MKHIRIPFLVVALSLTLTGMAFAIDIPVIPTWLAAVGTTPGTIITGVGGGGPGRGDVLLGPLYDCRDLTDPNLPGAAGITARPQATLISIVNTDHVFGVVGRIRFREWKRSIEVLDFDIPLTSNDVWVAQVSRVSTGGCVLTSPDMYITNIPVLATDPFLAAPIPAAGFTFNPLLITDGDANPIARTEYGEFEFIGEERFSALTASGTVIRLTVAAYVNGRDVQNVLEGTVYIVRPDVAISHQYNMTAIANFAIDTLGIYQSPISAFPTLYSAVQGGPNQALPANPGAGGFDNLEALLSKRFVDFQYVNGGQIGGLPVGGTTPMSTSLVISFPTKLHHYVHANVYPALADPPGGVFPYRIPFTGAREVLGDETRSTAVIPPLGTQDVGEVVECTIWDRSEHQLAPPTIPISPARTPLCRLPWQVNVIGIYPLETVSPNTFRNNWLIPSASATASQTFYSGWGRIDLAPPLGVLGGDTRTVRQGNGAFRLNPIVFNFFNNFFTEYYGLPAIGIVMSEFYSDTVAGYYGNTVPWQYGVDWANLPAIPHNPADPPNPR
jgi:hypothetical protein